jgi:hypothetical protein
MARTITEVSKLAAGPPLLAWEDYDAISRMPLIVEPGRVRSMHPAGGKIEATPDLELLAAFATGE